MNIDVLKNNLRLSFIDKIDEIFTLLEREKRKEIMELKIKYVQTNPVKFPRHYNKGIDALTSMLIPEELLENNEFKDILYKYSIKRHEVYEYIDKTIFELSSKVL